MLIDDLLGGHPKSLRVVQAAEGDKERQWATVLAVRNEWPVQPLVHHQISLRGTHTEQQEPAVGKVVVLLLPRLMTAGGYND